MAKFVTLVDAAKQLGVTPEEVNEMRQRQELYGYRDGTSWKFKPEDVEQLAVRRSSARSEHDSQEMYPADSREISDAPIALPVDLSDNAGEAEDVVLLSEFELGESGPGTSSTVIGKSGQQLSSLDSDVKLVSADEGGGASSTTIGVPGQPTRPGESVIKLEAAGVDEASASKTMLGVPGQPQPPGESAVKVQASSPDADSPSSTVIGKPGQPTESDVRVRAFEEDVFEFGTEPPSAIGGSGIDIETIGGSGVQVDAPAEAGPIDSGITLAEEHSDDDFVLGGPGSDITISPGDSGISLADPSDSGLSLDAPLELRAGGDGDSAFEMAGSSQELGAATEFDSDEVMELKTGDEFLLTPMAAEGEESEDSGSQVIALDTEASIEASAPSMFAESPAGGMGSMLEEDVSGSQPSLGDSVLGGAAAPALVGAMQTAPSMAAEAPYPLWIVLMLGFCMLFMALCGMMMYDLVRHMWSWSEPYRVNSTIMDLIVGK